MLDILIVGGGLGGLAAAAFLRKNHHVTVLERNQFDFSRNDYGIGVICNAYNLLQKIGINDRNLDFAVMVKTWTRTAENDEIFTRDFDTRKTYGVPSVLVRRSKLHAELYRLATRTELEGQPAKVLEGLKIERVDCQTATVYSVNGESFQGDFLIGADGINSVVRSAVLSGDGYGNQEAPAVTHDLVAYMAQLPVSAFAKIPQLSWFGDAVNSGGLASWTAPNGPDTKPGPIFTKRRILATHMSSTEAQIIGYTTEKEFGPQFDSLKTSIIQNVPAARAQTEFEGFFKPLVDLFEAGDNKIDVWRIRDIDPVDRWHRGKALLIGDAVHCVTPHAGQGCNMAIEDAEALGFLLKNAQTIEDVQAAIPTFLELRKERAQYIARASRHMGALLKEEDMEKSGEFDRVAFGKKTYAYAGAAAAIEAARAG